MMFVFRCNYKPVWRKPVIVERIKRIYKHASSSYDPYSGHYPNTDERRAYMKKYMRNRRARRGAAYAGL